MYKRITALVLAGAMMVPLAACKSEQEAQKSDVPTLTWLVPGDKQNDMARVTEKINEMLEEKIGAHLDLQFIDTGSYTEKITMNMASGSSFDLCFTGYVNPYLQSVERGGYLCLDDYMKDSALNDIIPDYALESAKYDGKLYGIPNLQVLANCAGLYIREDLADEYGLKTEDIKCLEDIEPFLEWVKQNHQDVYPFRTGAYAGGLRKTEQDIQGDTFVDCAFAYTDSDGSVKVIPTYETPTFLNEPKLIRSWFEKGYIRSDVASVLDDSSEVAAGKFAVWRGSYKPGYEQERNSKNSVKAKIIQIGEPIMSNGAGNTAMTAINKKTQYPDLAFKLLELANTDVEFYNLLCYGIEGTHYILDEDKKVSYVENSGYFPAADWKFGNQFNAYIIKGQDSDVWEKTKEFNDNAYKSKLLGFTLNTDSIRTEVAQVSKIVGQYGAFSKGSEPIENYFDNYVSNMEKAGVKKICDEVQRQVDEWLANNKK